MSVDIWLAWGCRMNLYLSRAIRVMLALERNTAMHWTQPIVLHSQD